MKGIIILYIKNSFPSTVKSEVYFQPKDKLVMIMCKKSHWPGDNPNQQDDAKDDIMRGLFQEGNKRDNPTFVKKCL